jgi:hypothetical protein
MYSVKASKDIKHLVNHPLVDPIIIGWSWAGPGN